MVHELKALLIDLRNLLKQNRQRVEKYIIRCQKCIMVESSLNNVSIRMSIEYLQIYFRHLCIPKFTINITILILNLSIPQFKMVYILWSLYFSTYPTC